MTVPDCLVDGDGDAADNETDDMVSVREVTISSEHVRTVQCAVQYCTDNYSTVQYSTVPVDITRIQSMMHC